MAAHSAGTGAASAHPATGASPGAAASGSPFGRQLVALGVGRGVRRSAAAGAAAAAVGVTGAGEPEWADA